MQRFDGQLVQKPPVLEMQQAHAGPVSEMRSSATGSVQSRHQAAAVIREFDMPNRYLIDNPGPFASKNEWEAFLKELSDLDQKNQDVQLAIAEARICIGSAIE